MTSPSLPDSLIEAMTSAAVASEVQRSTRTLSDLAAAELDPIRAELLQLRAVIAEQTATIASLRQQLDQAQRAGFLMPIEQLVTGLASAIATGTTELTGHVLSDIQLDLRTALTSNDGNLVAGEPAIAEPHLLSTIGVTLRPVPPPLGQPAAVNIADTLHTAAESAQVAMERVLSDAPAPAGAVMAALAALVQEPGAASSWAQVAAALPALASAAPAVADQARSLAEAAMLVQPGSGADMTTALLAAAASLTAFTDAVTAAYP